MKNREMGTGRFISGHEKMGGFSIGSKHSPSSKKKVSLSLVGRVNKCSRRWLGDAASYAAKHMWIIKHYGKAQTCQQKGCVFKNPKRYEWHNVSGRYGREKNDYVQLCPSCHRKIDMRRLKLCVL